MGKMSPLVAGMLAIQMTAGIAAGADPVKHFDPTTGTIIDQRWKSGIPLGGIGDGKIELLTDGSFGNFTNQGNWDRPYGWARGAFTAVRVQGAGVNATRMLRLKGDGEFAGVENVAHVQTQGFFPRATVHYTDDALPIRLRMEAFSPLIAHNVKDSSLPVACFDYVVSNASDKPLKVSLAMAWPNLLGWGGRGGTEYNSLDGDTQSTSKTGTLTGVRYTTSQKYIDQQANTIGQDFLAVRREPGVDVSTCTAWDSAADTPAFWSKFASTGKLPANADNGSNPAGAVSATVTLAPGQSKTLHFYMVWAMQNFIMVNPDLHWTDQFDMSTANIPSLAHKDGSRWSTNRGMRPGDHLVVDLGKVCTPASLTMDNGKELTDYPRGLKVEASVDGNTWSTVSTIASDDLFKAVNVIDLKSTPCRYIKLTNQGENGLYWSIYGMAVDTGSGIIDPVTATTYLVHFDAHTKYDHAGHFWQRYFNDAPSIATYVDKNRARLLSETRAWQQPVMASDVPFWLKLKLINCAFPMFSNTVLTKDGRFSVLESPIEMGGALGTMDQRMAAHAFMTAFFPELDATELEQYATCQMPDGRITHFDGNVHQVMVNPNVNYGITDWPDLSTSWVSQSIKLYRWTGDKSFLARVRPHITSAMTWLRKDGDDYEHIPAGGSTYDYESLPRGAFIYSASCYLGALRGVSAITGGAEQAMYNREFGETQASVMKNLWTGTYFRKWKQPTTGKTVDDSFVANLAGDWMTHISGLPSTLDADIVHQSIAQTIARNQKPFFPIPPMQVTPVGSITTSSCYTLQHEPYLGCEAIYGNYVDDGLDTIHRIYFSIWEENQSPWDESLCYDAANGHKGGLPTYMTCPTTWFVLDALAGASVDVPGHRLYLSPRLSTTSTQMHIPVYLSRFWGKLDYVPAQKKLTFTVTKVFGQNADLMKTLYHTAGAPGNDMPSTITLSSIAADGDSQPITLPAPFTVREGAVLDLSAYIGKLTPAKKSDVVNFMVKAPVDRPGLPADNWTLTDNAHDNPVMARIVGMDALDGNETSRWTTGRSLQPGDAVTLDMGDSRKVSRLVLDDTKYPGDYPQGYRLDGSVDGNSWTELTHQSEQDTMAAVKNGVLTIDFPSTTTRYLRVTSIGGHGLWWSIAEISAYDTSKMANATAE